MAQIEVKVKLDLPQGVELLGYERCDEGHGFEVKFPLPLYCRCEKCGVKEPAKYEGKNTVYAVRDLDLWGQPSFLIFQPYFHRCSRCGHRQEHFAPFKRKKVMYTYRFEEYVLRQFAAGVLVLHPELAGVEPRAVVRAVGPHERRDFLGRIALAPLAVDDFAPLLLLGADVEVEPRSARDSRR